MGLETHLYTSGVTRRAIGSTIVDALVNLTRVRFSIHGATESTYGRIMGVPLGRRGLATVIGLIEAVLAGRYGRPRQRAVGAGFVIQAANVHEIARMADVAARAGLDFLDYRGDAVGATPPLTAEEEVQVAGQIRAARGADGLHVASRMQVDLSDDLAALALGLRLEPAPASPCRVAFFRPAVSTEGILRPCNLQAERRFARGSREEAIEGRGLAAAMAAMAPGESSSLCSACMPFSRTANAMVDKIMADDSIGVGLADQPFTSANNRSHSPQTRLAVSAQVGVDGGG